MASAPSMLLFIINIIVIYQLTFESSVVSLCVFMETPTELAGLEVIIFGKCNVSFIR